MLAHYPGEGEDVDAGGAGALERLGAGADGRAGRHDVVTLSPPSHSGSKPTYREGGHGRAVVFVRCAVHRPRHALDPNEDDHNWAAPQSIL